MPHKHPSLQDRLQRLARLPRRKDLVIVGGKRPLGLFLREGQATFQPQVALWLEQESGIIRQHELINPQRSSDDGVNEALEALVEGLVRPPLSLVPPTEQRVRVLQPAARPIPDAASPARLGLPAQILVNDAALAEAAHALFAPLHVPVAYQKQLPAFEDAFAGLSAHLGAGGDAEPPQPFDWDLPQVAGGALPGPIYQTILPCCSAWATVAPSQVSTHSTPPSWAR